MENSPEPNSDAMEGVINGRRKGAEKIVTLPLGGEDYVRDVLDAYRRTPGTTGNLRRPDRVLAVQLHQRGIPLIKVQNALVLAAVRRLIRPSDAPPLTVVRSFAYFIPVIEEVLQMEVGEDYFRYARHKLQRLTHADQTPTSVATDS